MAYDPNKIFTVQMRKEVLTRAFFAIDNDRDRLEKEGKILQSEANVANNERLIRQTYEAEDAFADALKDGNAGKIFISFDASEIDQMLDTLSKRATLDEAWHHTGLWTIYDKIAKAAGKDTM